MRLKGDVEVFRQGLDGICQSICNPALTTHLSRIDTKDNHPHHSIYEADRIHFRTTRQGSFIREAMCGEFDYTPSSNQISMERYPVLKFQSVPLPNEVLRSVYEFIPRLWVLCVQISKGTHHVTTIYRGNALWPVVDRDGREVAELKTDDEIAAALAKVQACEGFDEAALKRFYQQGWDACVIHAATAIKTDEAIH